MAANVPVALRTALSTALLGPLETEEQLGMTKEQVITMLSFVSSSNYHTRMSSCSPPIEDKSKESKKLMMPEKFVLSFSDSCLVKPSHLNVFLQGYRYSIGHNCVPLEALEPILQMCLRNDPYWVFRVQQCSLSLLLHLLENRNDRNAANIIPRNVYEQLNVSTDSNHTILSALERAGCLSLHAELPPLSNLKPPQFTMTCTHFRFLVDTLSNDSGDKYFSANAKFKNEGKVPITIKVAQQFTFVDGNLLVVGNPAQQTVKNDSDEIRSSASSPTIQSVVENVDFQVLLEKNNLKKGEKCRLLLSLIAKPQAEFSTYQRLVILAIDDSVKVFVTFSVINPSLPLFGSPFPCCISQAVVESPLGAYEVPLALQILKHHFIRIHGYSSSDISHLLSTQSWRHVATNRRLLSDTLDARAALEEHFNAANLIPLLWSNKHTGSCITNQVLESAGRSLSPSGSPCQGIDCSEAHVTANATQRLIVPVSTAQPMGYTAGGVFTCTSSSSSSFTYLSLSPLNKCSAPQIFLLILLWYSELPIPIVDSSVMMYDDPQVYLEAMQPCLQGLVIYLIEFCCALLLHTESNGCSLRALALTIAPLLIKSNCHDTLASEQKRQPVAVLRANVNCNYDINDEEVVTIAQPEAVQSYVNLELHAVTAFIHWVKKYQSLFLKGV